MTPLDLLTKLRARRKHKAANKAVTTLSVRNLNFHHPLWTHFRVQGDGPDLGIWTNLFTHEILKNDRDGWTLEGYADRENFLSALKLLRTKKGS